jgi:glycosyltransferase involved in cell wall biosynthesis
MAPELETRNMTCASRRILFITYHFPPFMASGAVRTGQTARHLARLGHQVLVVSADDQPVRGGLPLEIPRQNVTYTPWMGSRLLSSKEGWRQRGAAPTQPPHRPSAPPNRSAVAVWHALRWLQRHAIYAPDRQIGWYPYAVRAALAIIRRQPIDLIFASAWPVTSLLVAATVARRSGLPWVGELRDLWSGHHYRELHGWQRYIDLRLERRVLDSATGLVTVSQPWADTLARQFTPPVRVVVNGFEPEHTAPAGSGGDRNVLRVVYLGWLYGGKRDPSAFFAALRTLRGSGRQVRAEFYGEDAELAGRMVEASGVGDLVSVLGPVAHDESLVIQASADVLLLLMYNAPGEEGVLPGKLFEYMGAGRPILAVGAPSGAVSDLITSRRLGLVSSDPGEIADQLSTWADEKACSGRVASYGRSAVADFERAAQVEKLSDFFCSLTARR